MTPRKLLEHADRELAEAERVIDLAVIARYYQVTTQSVRRWIKAGRIQADRTPTGRYKVLAADFDEIKAHERNA